MTWAVTRTSWTAPQQLAGFGEVEADRVQGQVLAGDGQDLDVGGLGGIAGVHGDPNSDLHVASSLLRTVRAALTARRSNVPVRDQYSNRAAPRWRPHPAPNAPSGGASFRGFHEEVNQLGHPHGGLPAGMLLAQGHEGERSAAFLRGALRAPPPHQA